jgi:hypothetical protein
LSRLGELLRRHDISEVIVSSRVPDPGHLRQLSEVCEGRGVPVVRLTIRLDTDTREAM